MNARSTTIDPDLLARNLELLAEERKGRLRRMAIRNRPPRRGWLLPFGGRYRARSRARIWWVAPATWAIVFSIGFLLNDWFWDALGQTVARFEP